MGQTIGIKNQPASHPSPAATPHIVTDTLNNLVQTCADGAYGFASCADYTNISRHRTLFRQRAQDCDAAGAQLQAMILRLGGQPIRGVATGGMSHRGWVAVRGTLSGLRDQSILAECERGESLALERYRIALAQSLPSEVRDLLQRQYDGVEFNLGQMQMFHQVEKAAA